MEMKIELSEQEVFDRLNEILRPDGVVVRRSTPKQKDYGLGDYHVEEIENGNVCERHINLEAHAKMFHAISRDSRMIPEKK